MLWMTEVSQNSDGGWKENILGATKYITTMPSSGNPEAINRLRLLPETGYWVR